MTEKTAAIPQKGSLIYKWADDPPWYGLVVDRGVWIEETSRENQEMVKRFLELEDSHGSAVVPVFVMGYRIGSRPLANERGLEPYLQRCNCIDLGGHYKIIKTDLEILKEILSDISKLHSSQYLKRLLSELEVLVNYLGNPRLTKGPGDASFQLWDLFRRAIPR